MWIRVRSMIRLLTGRHRFENGMAEELRFHIDQYAEDLVRSGVSRDEAMRRARMEFGNVDNVRADCREARGLRLFDELEQNLRYAVRLMRRTPGFTAATLATLALCLGANLTIFAVVDAVLLRPLPFPAADRLVKLFNTYPGASVPNDGCSLTNYYERRGRIPAFAQLAIYREGVAIIGEPGSTDREFVTRVSPEFFATLGMGPAFGRAFTERETTYQTDSVAILSDAYWRQRLNADPNVIGRKIRVDGLEKIVVGVLPADFGFLSSKARLYFPLASNADQRGPESRHWGSQAEMIARVKDGVTLAEAQSQIDAHNAAMEKGSPEAKMMAAVGFRSMVVPLRADHVAAIRPTLLLVQAGVLALLVIGAVNVANLLLIRGAGRVREFAVRQAIGASRRHVVNEVVVETTVLTLAGGLLGLAVGAGGIRLLTLLGTDRLPLGTHIAFDARVALVAIAAAILVGIAISVPIVWYNLHGHSASALQTQSRVSTASRGAQRMRHGFLVAQIALGFVLLSGAGLLGLSLKQVMEVAPGFRAENVLTGQITLPWKNYQDGSSRLAFIEGLVGALDRQPGVLASGIATNVPFSGNSGKSAATIKGQVPKPGESHGIYSYGVGGDYFNAMGFSLREGRILNAADSRRPERVCVVDEDFARRYFPRGHTIGQRLFMGSQQGPDSEAFTIVGVVGAVKQAALTDDEAHGAVFYPFRYRVDGDIFVVTRTIVPPETLGTALQRVVRGLDAEVPVADLLTMEGRIADSLVSRRSPAVLASAFSGIAVLLIAIGTYGVLSYAVALRRREIALRLALGARPQQIRRQFVSLAGRLLAVGATLGIAGAWATGRAMQAVLFQVPAFHVATLVATTVLLSVVALAACVLPSNRASRISPMEALAE
jgi:predicted permease